MRTDLQCRQCQTRLAAKIELQGKYVRCPRCRNPVKVTLRPVVLQALGANNTPVEEEMLVGVPIEDEVLPAVVMPEVVEEDEASASEPATPEPTPEEPPTLKKKRKKKFKSKSKAQAQQGFPAWVWALFVLGAMITTAGLIGGLYLALRVNTPDGYDVPWVEYSIAFAIGVPITLVILIISMFLSSALGGGINFGDAKTAIIGSIFLIIIVNLVYLIPGFGPYLTLFVWLIGFMTVFGLDPWEARFLLLINWVLNYFIGFALLHYTIHKIDKMKDEGEDEIDKMEFNIPKRGNDLDQLERRLQEKNRKSGDQRGKDPDDDEQGYFRPQEWHNRMSDWVRTQLI